MGGPVSVSNFFLKMVLPVKKTLCIWKALINKFNLMKFLAYLKGICFYVEQNMSFVVYYYELVQMSKKNLIFVVDLCAGQRRLCSLDIWCTYLFSYIFNFRVTFPRLFGNASIWQVWSKGNSTKRFFGTPYRPRCFCLCGFIHVWHICMMNI